MSCATLLLLVVYVGAVGVIFVTILSMLDP